MLSDARSYWEVAENFSNMNPDRVLIEHKCVGKFMTKFKEAGSILDNLHRPSSTVLDTKTFNNM